MPAEHPTLERVDGVLRRIIAAPTPDIGGWTALLVGVGFALLYGLAMGTFSGLWDGRTWQLLYSAVKVPMLLFVAFGVALPGFFVLNVLAGVGSDFKLVLQSLLASQAGVAVVLLALAPVTLFWYASFNDYEAAILVNAVVFGTASIAGQVRLATFYRPLVAGNPVHRRLRFVWLGIYAFVGVQAGWVLRPFIGQPGSAETFFREGAWGNAYIELWQIVSRAFGG
jgi:hypothetical protein